LLVEQLLEIIFTFFTVKVDPEEEPAPEAPLAPVVEPEPAAPLGLLLELPAPMLPLEAAEPPVSEPDPVMRT